MATISDMHPERQPRGEPAGTEPGERRSRWVVLAAVSSGLFLAVTSTTVVSVALPTIGQRLHAGDTALEWVVDAYTVVYASLLVAGGTLGDRFGRKGLFIAGAGIFAAGALGCGLAQSVAQLVAARVIQGTGAALLVPGSLAIIRASFEDHRERAAAIGIWSTSSGVALAAGPPLGGVLVQELGWRSVFLTLAVLGTAVAAGGARFIPRLKPATAPPRFDSAGAFLVTAGLGALAFGAIEGQAQGWAAPRVTGALAGGALALAGFVFWERRRADPMVDISLFARPSFTAANLAAFVVFFAFVGAIVYFSAYFQQVQHHSAVSAGAEVSAIGVSYAIAATLTGRVVPRTGERAPLVTGLAVAGIATLGLLRLGPSTPAGTLWWNFAVLGAAIGMCGTPISTVAMSAVGQARAGMASAIINATRQIGQVFGIAVLGAIVYSRLPAAAAGPLPSSGGMLFTDGLRLALVVCGVSLLVAAAAVGVLTVPGRLRAPARR